jgi:hypothetical protein
MNSRRRSTLDLVFFKSLNGSDEAVSTGVFPKALVEQWRWVIARLGGLKDDLWCGEVGLVGFGLVWPLGAL